MEIYYYCILKYTSQSNNKHFVISKEYHTTQYFFIHVLIYTVLLCSILFAKKHCFVVNYLFLFDYILKDFLNYFINFVRLINLYSIVK